MTKKIALFELFKHPLVIALVAGLISLGGICLGYYFTSHAWETQRKFDVLKEQNSESTLLFNELRDRMGKRFFNLNRVFWSLINKDRTAHDAAWQDYYPCVIEWNSKMLYSKFALAKYAGNELTDRFYNDNDAMVGYVIGDPKSVHGQFVKTHKLILQLSDMLNSQAPLEYQRDLIETVKHALQDLSSTINAFTEKYQAILDAQESNLLNGNGPSTAIQVKA